MRQLRVFGESDLRLVEIDKPTIGAKDVIVRIAKSGICGTDLSWLKKGGVRGPSGTPLPLGHEFVGWVDEVGGDVADINTGDRVTVNPIADGNLIGCGDPAQGSFGDSVLIRNARLGSSLFRLPEQMNFDDAIVAEPIAVGAHALEVSEFKAGDRVVVFGAGPIGLGLIVSLRYRGAGHITVVDKMDSRLTRATALGADEVVNTAEGVLFDQLVSIYGARSRFGLTGADVDLFIDAAGFGPLLTEMIVCAGPGTRIGIVAQHKTPVSIDFQQFLTRQLKMFASSGYEDEFPQVLAMLADKKVDTSAMVSHRFPLSDFHRAFETAYDAGVSGKVVLDMMEAADAV